MDLTIAVLFEFVGHIPHMTPIRITQIGPYDAMMERSDAFDRQYAMELRIPDKPRDQVEDWFG